MKYIKCFVLYLLCFILCQLKTGNVGAAANHYEIRACWISYIDIRDNLRDLTEEEFTLRYRDMLERLLDNNLNTVIVHVRPMGDAIYPSDYFPWSQYICSDSKGLTYDPLEIMVEESHKQGIRLEAWINPYRISLSDDTTMYYRNLPHYELYKEYMLEYYNSSGEVSLSLNPASEQARKLIIQGIIEIVENYDVDGIHFDDYFYVDGMGGDVLPDERKDNVNLLIRSVYETIKTIRPDCQFGISPAGNIDYARGQGADVDTWLSQEGYIDYIMPQLYWTDNYIISGKNVSLYSDTCQKWQEINVLDKTMLVGLALYKVGEAYENDLDWSRSNHNLRDQYEIACNCGYDGYGLFRYQWLEESIAYTELSNLNSTEQGEELIGAGLLGFSISIIMKNIFSSIG